MMLRLLALTPAVFATPALSQSYDRPDLVRGLCRPDGCDEFTILSAERLRTTDKGALLKTRIKGFHASYAGRKPLGEENGYVHCSSTKPAIMAEQNGRVAAFYLAPFATEESRESVRRNATFHALYFAICHGPEAGRSAVRDLAGVARSHGYRVALTRSRLASLNRAEDVLRPDEQRAIEERRPERPPVQAIRTERPIDREPSRRAPPALVVEEDKGLMSGPRRLTNRAFDALDEFGNALLGRRP